VLFRANTLHDTVEIYSRILFGSVKEITLPVIWPIALVIGLIVYDLAVRFNSSLGLGSSVRYRWGAYYVATSCIVVVFCLHVLRDR
jgi:hypothetical protein